MAAPKVAEAVAARNAADERVAAEAAAVKLAAAALKKLKYQMKMYVSLPLVQKLVMRNCMPTWLEMIKIIETGIILLIDQVAA